ncbi:uncharacterized protein EDB93DRAFT_1255000 [Suillus bovinus]|uniref:uncharacterized protein n=1 Tax=Suillus bovinus TaxID=48563 RepID=UPI001B8718CD|nr:uncharacterized protein EDB93DRAFT_1255000 [Suillus bovinus]KAG2133225.1 hypothetical protein EDB93DRAFT_1255000 [Suillus bovinus]
MAVDHDAYSGGQISAPSVSVYPQAFLRNIGHIQCDAVLPHFAPFISNIRHSTSRRPRTVNLNDDQPLPTSMIYSETESMSTLACLQSLFPVPPALHDVQQGRITSALAGAYGNPPTKVTHNARVRECKMSLPHQRYDNKIGDDDVPRALRLENIYIIQCDSLKPEALNGIMSGLLLISFFRSPLPFPPFIRTSSFPSPVLGLSKYFQALRPHICVFASHAFPQIYQWTTFGITSLLERLWAYHLPILEAGNKPRHEAIELCSGPRHKAHETLVARSKPPRAGTSYLFPSVRITTAVNNPIIISAADWPTLDNLNVPAIASRRSQVLTYGLDHFEAYKAAFHIELSINKLSPHVFLQYSTQERHCIVIALVALRSYLADVKALVATAVKKECSANGEDVDSDQQRPNRDKDRLKSLQKWLACEHPLGYKDKAYEHLLRCIVHDPSDFSDGLPNSSKEKMSVQDFAAHICKMTRVESPSSVAAPLIFTAPSTAVFRIAYARMLKYAPSHSPAAAENAYSEVYIIAANHLQIQHVPWHAPHAGGRGRPSRKAAHDSWINLGKSAVVDHTSSAIARANTQPVDLAAEAAKKAQASDARAPWAVESITLQSLPDFFARDSLPDEFSLEHIEFNGDAILTEIYEWAFANFDRDKPLHKIALLAGIYFSHVLPDVFWDPKDKPDNGKLLSERSTTNAVRSLPWTPNKGSRKGSTWRPQFIAMVPAYIISWNSKNSAKGIGSLNLVRMGLARARSSRIFKGGVPLSDWILLTQEELSAKYKEIMACLQDRQYGPFKIAVMFFGLDKAVELGTTTGTYTNHPSMSSIALKKRPAPHPESDSEVEVIEHVQHKRSKH